MSNQIMEEKMSRGLTLTEVLVSLIITSSIALTFFQQQTHIHVLFHAVKQQLTSLSIDSNFLEQ